MSGRLTIFLSVFCLLLQGCASMRLTPENSFKVPGTLSDLHDITLKDNLLTIQPVVPLFGTINAGQTTGSAGAVTGLDVTSIHQRFGTLSAEGLYYLTFNASDNFYKDKLEHPYPFGKFPKVGYRLTYDIPLFHLRRTSKVMPVIIGYSDNSTSYNLTYLYADMDVPRERLFSLRAGIAGSYMSKTFHSGFYNSPFQYPEHVRVYQMAHSLKTGVVFTQTANTSFNATVMDPRFTKPVYHGFKRYRHEAYVDLDFYVSGSLKNVLTGEFVDGDIVYTETDPVEFMKLYKTGFEAGYRWMLFFSKHGMMTTSIAFGSGTGYVAVDSKPYFVKARIQIGFGVVKNGD